MKIDKPMAIIIFKGNKIMHMQPLSYDIPFRGACAVSFPNVIPEAGKWDGVRMALRYRLS